MCRLLASWSGAVPGGVSLLCDEMDAECSFLVARFKKPPYELSGDEGVDPTPDFAEVADVADAGVLAIGCGADADADADCFGGTAGPAEGSCEAIGAGADISVFSEAESAFVGTSPVSFTSSPSVAVTAVFVDEDREEASVVFCADELEVPNIHRSNASVCSSALPLGNLEDGSIRREPHFKRRLT